MTQPINPTAPKSSLTDDAILEMWNSAYKTDSDENISLMEFFRSIADAAVAADRAQQTVKEKLYDELLYAVGTKLANETRHQTALKYIRRAESEYNDIAAQQKGDE